MELFFLRHGIAEELDGIRYKTDSERPLSKEGVEKIREIAKAIRKMEIPFTSILSSPYVRAKQTAQLVHDDLKDAPKLEFSENLVPQGSQKKLFSELVSLKKEKSEHVLLVGHEPHISSTVSTLLMGDSNLMIDVKKGGFCHVSVDFSTKQPIAILRFLLTSKQLRMMTGN